MKFILIVFVAVVAVSTKPTAKATHELSLLEMTQEHLTALMADAPRVAAVTACFVDLTTCESAEAMNLHNELSKLGQGRSCIACSVEEQKKVGAVLKAFAGAYKDKYLDQFNKAAATNTVLQNLLKAPKATHELLMQEYTATHLHELMKDTARVKAVTKCFTGADLGCSAEGKNLFDNLKKLMANGGSCTTCTPEEKKHVQVVLAEFVQAYKDQHLDLYTQSLPALGPILAKLSA